MVEVPSKRITWFLVWWVEIGFATSLSNRGSAWGIDTITIFTTFPIHLKWWEVPPLCQEDWNRVVWMRVYCSPRYLDTPNRSLGKRAVKNVSGHELRCHIPLHNSLTYLTGSRHQICSSDSQLSMRLRIKSGHLTIFHNSCVILERSLNREKCPAMKVDVFKDLTN